LKSFLGSKEDAGGDLHAKEYQRVYGDTSRFLAESNNIFAKVNGGTIDGVLSN
jgi:hypothetical protein